MEACCGHPAIASTAWRWARKKIQHQSDGRMSMQASHRPQASGPRPGSRDFPISWSEAQRDQLLTCPCISLDIFGVMKALVAVLSVVEQNPEEKRLAYSGATSFFRRNKPFHFSQGEPHVRQQFSGCPPSWQPPLEHRLIPFCWREQTARWGAFWWLKQKRWLGAGNYLDWTVVDWSSTIFLWWYARSARVTRCWGPFRPQPGIAREEQKLAMNQGRTLNRKEVPWRKVMRLSDSSTHKRRKEVGRYEKGRRKERGKKTGWAAWRRISSTWVANNPKDRWSPAKKRH